MMMIHVGRKRGTISATNTNINKGVVKRYISSLSNGWSITEQTESLNKDHSLSNRVTKGPIHVLQHEHSNLKVIHMETRDESYGFMHGITVDHSNQVISNALAPVSCQFLFIPQIRKSLNKKSNGSFQFDTTLSHLQSLYHISTSNKSKSLNQLESLSRDLFSNGESFLSAEHFDQHIFSMRENEPSGELFGMIFAKTVMEGVNISAYIYRYLFEGTAYENAQIPIDLVEVTRMTQSDLVQFYRSHYVASNATVTVYGKHTLADIENNHLPLLSSALLKNKESFVGSFGKSNKVVQRWTKPRTETIRVPSDTTQQKEPCLFISYLFSEDASSYDRLCLKLISSFLTHNSAEAPIHQAVVSSGLASSINMNYSTFQSSLENPSVTIGLNAVNPQNAPNIEMILDYLLDILPGKIQSGNALDVLFRTLLTRLDIFSASVHKLAEDQIRQLHVGPNILDKLDTIANVKKIQSEVAEKGVPEFVKHYLEKYFIGNTHRLTLITVPDKHYMNSVQNKMQEVLRNRNPHSTLNVIETLSPQSQPQVLRMASNASGLSNLTCFPDLERLFVNEQTSAGDVVHSTVTLSSRNIEIRLLPLLPLLCNLIPLLGAREADATQWKDGVINRYTTGMNPSYTIQFARGSAHVVLSLTSSCLYQNVYKMLDSLSAFMSDSHVKSADTNIVQHLPQLVRSRKAQLDQNIHMNLGEMLRIDAASSLSSYGKLRGALVGFQAHNFFMNLSGVFSEDKKEQFDQLAVIQGALQTLYFQLVKFGELELFVTTSPEKKNLIKEAATSHFNLSGHKDHVGSQAFTPKGVKKYICSELDENNLMSGSMCRTASHITSPEQAAMSYMLIELVKMYYETDPELSKLPVSLQHTIDGIIGVSVVHHQDAFDILTEIDGLLCNNHNALSEVYEKLEDDQYDAGYDLLSVLKARVLNTLHLSEVPIFNPHDRYKRELDPIEQTAEFNTLPTLKDALLNITRWEPFMEYCMSLKTETQSSITLYGPEKSMPYEVKVDKGRKWLIMGAKDKPTHTEPTTQQDSNDTDFAGNFKF